MKFEQLFKVPRSARTIQLVVNVPEASAHSVPPPPVKDASVPKIRDRVWSFLKVAGPVIVSMSAIIISIFSLQEQRQADYEQRQVDVAAATASQRQEAERVSFLEEPSLSQATSTLVLLENLSTAPVGVVSLYIRVENVSGIRLAGPVAFYLLLGSMPACSSATINVGPLTVRGLDLPKAIFEHGAFINVSSMIFSDSNGLNWQYNGQLQQVASSSISLSLHVQNNQAQYQLPLNVGALGGAGVMTVSGVNPIYKPANGCA